VSYDYRFLRQVTGAEKKVYKKSLQKAVTSAAAQ
jgi:hypothetical protein